MRGGGVRPPLKDRGSPGNQNENFRPSCICRAVYKVLPVLVTLPKLARGDRHPPKLEIPAPTVVVLQVAVALVFAAEKLYKRLSTAKMPLLGTGLYRLKTLKASQRNSNRVRSVGLNSRLMRMSTSKNPGPTKRELRLKNGTLAFRAFPFPSTAPHVSPPSRVQTANGDVVPVAEDGKRLDMSASTGRPS